MFSQIESVKELIRKANQMDLAINHELDKLIEKRSSYL